MAEIIVTENWSGRRFALTWPWTCQREFVVTGTDDEQQALTASFAGSATLPPCSIPQENEAHPDNSRLICRGPTVQQWKGPTHVVISCQYDCPESGEHSNSSKDPLKQSAKISWSVVEESVSVDIDLDGRPIVSTAGEPVPPVPRVVTYKRLMIRKNFPYYDLLLSETYENAVNEKEIVVPGIGLVKEQHMRCASVIPAEEYEATAPFVTMAFCFDLVLDDSLGPYPFQHRLLDAGTEGWYVDGSDTKPGRFMRVGAGTVEEVSQPIRLDGAGRPIADLYPGTSIKVANKTPVSPPVAARVWKSESQRFDNKTHAVFLYYKKTRILDLGPLLAKL